MPPILLALFFLPGAGTMDVSAALQAAAPTAEDARLAKLFESDHEVGTHALKYSLWSVENDNRFEFDPRVYGEYISDSVCLLFTQSSLPRERNVENAAKRIK